MAEKLDALLAECDALRAALGALRQAARGLEKHAQWSMDHCSRSPSSHQEFIRQDEENWSEYLRAQDHAAAVLANPAAAGERVRAALAVAEAMERGMECRAAACRPGTSDEQKRMLEDKAAQYESAAFRALDRYRAALDAVQGGEEDSS